MDALKPWEGNPGRGQVGEGRESMKGHKTAEHKALEAFVYSLLPQGNMETVAVTVDAAQISQISALVLDDRFIQRDCDRLQGRIFPPLELNLLD